MQRLMLMPDCMCVVCGRAFSSSDALVRHMRIHTSARRFLHNMRERGYLFLAQLTQYMSLSHFDRTSGAQVTTHTQHTESSHGIIDTATVTSPRGTAIVTTVQSATLATITVSQASGTFTATQSQSSFNLERDYGNECPICLDSLNDGVTTTTPCCNTKFHNVCLLELQETSPGRGFTCPMGCRKLIMRLRESLK